MMNRREIGDRRTPPTVLMNETRGENNSERAVAIIACAAAVVGLASSILWDVVRYDNGELTADASQLVTIGADKARLFQVAMIADMLGSYLLFLPIVVYMRLRFRTGNELAVDVVSAAGLAYVIVGAAGAGVLASAGPPLIRDYASMPPADAAAVVTSFTTVSDAVLGLWQLVAGSLLAVWWIGIGVVARDQWRWFGRVTVVFGVITLLAVVGSAIATAHESSVPATVIFFPLAAWPAWFAITLWPRRTASS